MATNCSNYDFNKIEKFWQKFWADNKTFSVAEDEYKQKYYVLDMFPYPSGSGLHIGHPEGYTASDILARYKKACGFNVLHPMGWDAFGLPAEQHAIKTGIPPAENTAANIETFSRQIKSLGFAIDWDREINTTDPQYFKWTQWIFLQLFKHGLAYVDKRPVWWCEDLKAVLSNEEVVNGKSERGDFPVERKNLRQWVLKITAYADKLLDGLNDIDWPDSTKRQQIAWIGKSEGANVRFQIENSKEVLTVYTTRADTLFGVTYIAVAPEHEILQTIVTNSHKSDVEAYIGAAKSKSDLDRTDLAKAKSGVFTGTYAINPVNGKKVEVWVADYVLASYGTGVVMAVPTHDERDWEFAKKYKLPIIDVIADPSGSKELPFCEDGVLKNSGKFDGLDSSTARKEITEFLSDNDCGSSAINYKLRDWLFSRQRYWGEPIPIIWVNEQDFKKISKSCGALCEFLPKNPVSFEEEGEKWFAVSLNQKSLPLELPVVESYLPSSNGESPLSHAPDWLNIVVNVVTGECKSSKVQKAGGDWIFAKRETNTMPQWAGSCWYYLRYLSPNCSERLVSESAEKYWGCPDFYIGGSEHAVLHLLYARFWHRFLFDIGAITCAPEPFNRIFHQGIILGEDGVKMSKSKGNVINPDDIVEEYGADSLRLYEMFLGPLEAMKPWSTKGIEGVVRFLRKIWLTIIDADGGIEPFAANDDPEVEKLLHATIKKVGEDIDSLRFNTAISQLMTLLNSVSKSGEWTKKSCESFLILLAPLAPHIAEELWARIGNNSSISVASWPKFDDKLLIESECCVVIQVNGKMRGECVVSKDISQEDITKIAFADEKVTKFIHDKFIAKVVFIPGKILNIVVK